MGESNLIYHLDTPPWGRQGRSKSKTRPGVKCPWGQRVKSRIPYIDYDYVDKLSKEEVQFLKKFTDEYYGGSFSGKRLHKDKKECYNRNNRMQRCIHAKFQMYPTFLKYYEDLEELDRKYLKRMVVPANIPEPKESIEVISIKVDKYRSENSTSSSTSSSTSKSNKSPGPHKQEEFNLLLYLWDVLWSVIIRVY